MWGFKTIDKVRHELPKMAMAMGLTLAAGLAFSGSEKAWAGDQDFVLVNNTGYAIHELYISPTQEDDWEEDILGRDVLDDHDRTTIGFSRSEDACMWDMKAVFEDGLEVEWSALDLCEISVVALTYDHDTGETSARVE